MNNEYLLISIAILVGVSMSTSTMLLVYKKGVAIFLTAVTCAIGAVCVFAGFVMGKEGITIGRAAVTLAIVMPILIVLLWYMARRLIKPLKTLVEVTGQLAQGQIDQVITMEARDELGELFASLNELRAYMQTIAGAAQQIADGDLTVRVDPKSNRDTLSRSFGLMVERLDSVVASLKHNSQQLYAASDQLALTADQAGQATDQIAATMQQIASGASQQVNGITETTSSINEISQEIIGVASGVQQQMDAVERSSAITEKLMAFFANQAKSAENSLQGSKQAAQTVEMGVSKLAALMREIQAIKASVEQSAERVKEMGQRTDQIGGILDMIEDIAAQTNLLALNATIEAARAGEQGKGFAVVADEVRKLAERSTTATRDIGGLIQNIQHTKNQVVQSMTDSLSGVDNGVTRAQEASEVLDKIMDGQNEDTARAERVVVGVRELSRLGSELVNANKLLQSVAEENGRSAAQMMTSSGKVTAAMDNIASVSEENSAAVEEVSASAEEMSAQVQEVTASVQTLAEMSRNLQELVDGFRLNEGAKIQIDAAQKKAGPALWVNGSKQTSPVMSM
jgi:methyl-accepting chemotaxis protein